MESDNISWLKSPIHKNTLKHLEFKWQESSEIMDSIQMSFDGSIVSVLTTKVLKKMTDPEILRIRIGFDKMPSKFEIKNEEQFFDYLAHFVEIAEE